MDRLNVNLLLIPRSWRWQRSCWHGRCTGWMAHPNEVLYDNRLIVSGSASELRGYLFTMATRNPDTAGLSSRSSRCTFQPWLPSTVHACCASSCVITPPVGPGMFVAAFAYCIAGAMIILPAEVQPRASDHYYSWIVPYRGASLRSSC